MNARMKKKHHDLEVADQKESKKKRLWSFDAMVANVTDFIKSDKTGEAALKSVHVAVRDKALDNLMKHSFSFGSPFSELAKEAIQTAVNNI